MPPIEEDDCPDTAVLWPAGLPYDTQGQPTIGAPVELAYPNGVRWCPSTSQVLDPKGNLISLDATVVVLQDIPIGSHMWLGCLDDWAGSGGGVQDDQLMVVKTFTRTPMFEGDKGWDLYRRTVGLMRFHQ